MPSEEKKNYRTCERTNKTLRNLRTSEQFVNVNNDSQVPESRGKWRRNWRRKPKDGGKELSVRLPIRKSPEGKVKGNRGNVLQKIKVKGKND